MMQNVGSRSDGGDYTFGSQHDGVTTLTAHAHEDWSNPGVMGEQTTGGWNSGHSNGHMYMPPTQTSCTDFGACSYAWHIGPHTEHCVNQQQDSGETGVDCGGSCPACQIDGDWGSYGDWTDCTSICGPGTMTASRLCNNPEPSAGGKPCDGEFSETKPCENNPVCEVDPGEMCSSLDISAPSSFDVDLVPGPAFKLMDIPVGKEKFWVRVTYADNLDQQASDSDLSLWSDAEDQPIPLVSYDASLHFGGKDGDTFREGDMEIEACTDSCQLQKVVHYREDPGNGASQCKGDSAANLCGYFGQNCLIEQEQKFQNGQLVPTGEVCSCAGVNGCVEHTRSPPSVSTGSAEWVYISKVLEPMHIKIKAYSHSQAKVEYAYDCPSTCTACTQTTAESGIDALKQSTGSAMWRKNGARMLDMTSLR